MQSCRIKGIFFGDSYDKVSVLPPVVFIEGDKNGIGQIEGHLFLRFEEIDFIKSVAVDNAYLFGLLMSVFVIALHLKKLVEEFLHVYHLGGVLHLVEGVLAEPLQEGKERFKLKAMCLLTEMNGQEPKDDIFKCDVLPSHRVCS